MPMMDLKSKPVSWFGSVFQKFETMCQEVDNIVSQDTVKCVGNQVQSVGESMKKFYADVVQDIVPPLDPLHCEADGGVPPKNAALGTSFKSTMGMEIRQGHTNMVIQSSKVLNDSARSMDRSSTALGGSFHVNQPTSAISREQDVREESCSASEIFGNVSAKEDLFINAEQMEMKSESSATGLLILSTSDGRESFEASFSSEHIAFGCETSSVNLNEDLPATSPVHCKEFQFLQGACENKRAHEDHVMGEDKNDIMGEYSAEVLELSTLDGRESLEVPFFSEPIDCDCENTTALMDTDSPEKSVNCEELQALQKAGRVCDGPLDDFNRVFESPNSDCMSEMAFLVSPCDERSKGMDFPSSTNCGVAELNCPLHNSESSIPIENVTYVNPATDLSSTASLPTESFMSKAGKETASSYSTLSFESIGYSNSSSYMNNDLNGTEMENIDLSDQTKLEDSCIIVDDNMLHEVSRRTRRLRSYKKKIQDVFTPKKILAKEYEMLAIWYGDCDMGSSQKKATTRSLSAASFAGENLQIQQIHDSEWELL